MGRDLLLISLVFAVIFLLGVQVLADTNANLSLQSPEEDFVIVVKALPKSKLNLVESDAPQSRATASLAPQMDDSEFKIKIHPVAEIR